MGRGWIAAREQGVQLLLGLGNALRNGITQTPQTRRADGDEEGGNGLAALPEVVQAGRYQVAAGKISEFHGGMVPAPPFGGQSAAQRVDCRFGPSQTGRRLAPACVAVCHRSPLAVFVTETVACSTAVESAPVTVPYTAAVANILTNSLLRLLRELRELLAHDFDFRLHLWLRIRPEREIVPVRSNRADRVAGESG